jgi:hypothetical protein
VKRNWNLAKAWLARELRKGDQKMPEKWDQVKELFALASGARSRGAKQFPA